jgi:hypothetical protein
LCAQAFRLRYCLLQFLTGCRLRREQGFLAPPLCRCAHLFRFRRIDGAARIRDGRRRCLNSGLRCCNVGLCRADSMFGLNDSSVLQFFLPLIVDEGILTAGHRGFRLLHVRPEILISQLDE